ncbi:hypothetical protein AOQ84DRAFT_426296 [Glonium stellatum]|uniref:Uncharacterized protein n=1 Tax=Glonium stellatum TaxID=574774 RepID=A0A8E2JLR2_9PEZI|nr:hypothetical protein AOQ84DRAFT_426296 [Glonium stellatum]
MDPRTLKELTQTAEKEGFIRAQRLPMLSAKAVNFVIEWGVERVKARTLLATLRMQDPKWVDPGRQKRRVFRSARKQTCLNDPGQRTYEFNELGAAPDHVVRNLIQGIWDLGTRDEQLGIAQVLIDHEAADVYIAGMDGPN